MKPHLNFVLVILLVLIPSACSPTQTQPDPASLVIAWQDAANAGDVEAELDLLTDDAILIAPSGTYEGKEKIRGWLGQDASKGTQLEFSNIQVNGDKVTWHTKAYRGGSLFRELDQTALVQQGKFSCFSLAQPCE